MHLNGDSITIFKIFIWESSDIRSEIMYYGSARMSRKLNFRPYKRRYTCACTSLNENLEYSYPLIYLPISPKPYDTTLLKTWLSEMLSKNTFSDISRNFRNFRKIRWKILVFNRILTSFREKNFGITAPIERLSLS